MPGQNVQVIQFRFRAKIILRLIGKRAHSGRTYNSETVENRETIRIFPLLF